MAAKCALKAKGVTVVYFMRFCLTLSLPTGNIFNLTLLTCLFVQPIAAHDFNIFLFDTSFNANLEESSCEEHCSQ